MSVSPVTVSFEKVFRSVEVKAPGHADKVWEGPRSETLATLGARINAEVFVDTEEHKSLVEQYKSAVGTFPKKVTGHTELSQFDAADLVGQVVSSEGLKVVEVRYMISGLELKIGF